MSENERIERESLSASARAEVDGRVLESDDSTVGQVADDAREALRQDISEALGAADAPNRSGKPLVAVIIVVFALALVAAIAFGFARVLPAANPDEESTAEVAASESAEGSDPAAKEALDAQDEPSESAGQDPLVGHWGVNVFVSEDDEEEATDPSTFFADFNADGTASITSKNTTVYYEWSFALETENDIGLTRNYTLHPNDGASEDLFVTIGVEEGRDVYNLGVISDGTEGPSATLGISKS